MRTKYRSAIYYFQEYQRPELRNALSESQADFNEEIITKILPFVAFKSSPAQYQNYYQNDPEKPFCRTYIYPKLKFLKSKYSASVNEDFLENKKIITSSLEPYNYRCKLCLTTNNLTDPYEKAHLHVACFIIIFCL